MTFDYPGYDLKFVQRARCKDGSSHLFTYVFKFHSPITRYFYILRAEFHEEDVFVIKFYVKAHRKSDLKYSKIVNRGDYGNIFISCVKCIPLLLEHHPSASFGLIGSPSYDSRSKRIESYFNNQRFKIYSRVAAEKIGTETFTHIKDENISGYLLINNCHTETDKKMKAIKDMFAKTYNNIPY